MTHFISHFSLAAMLLCSASAMLAEDKVHKLPADKTAPVIVYDSVGGFTPPPVNDDPVMVIRGDGTVTLGNRFQADARITAKITVDELQELLRLAIDQNDIFEFSATKVKTQIEDQRKNDAANGVVRSLIAIADAPSTVVKIHADGKEHEAKYYALYFAARQHKDIESLSQLQNITKKLQDLSQRLRKEAMKE